MKTTIIITNFNYGRYVARAIRSCLDQSERVEIIVVDDHSTDDSVAIIEAFTPYIKFIKLTTNLGIAGARNAGLEHATGAYIMFLDADDCIHRDMAKILGTYLDFNQWVDAVESDYFVVDENMNVLDRRSPLIEPLACGVLYRHGVFGSLGGYKNVKREDREFRTRFLNKQRCIACIDIPLYRYRYHGCNTLLKKPTPQTQFTFTHVDGLPGTWSTNKEN